jgi:hypothetical protein
MSDLNSFSHGSIASLKARAEVWRPRIKAELERRRKTQFERQQLAEHFEQIRHDCRKFSGFIKRSWHILEPAADYKASWHHDAIGEHIEAVHRGEIQRLQINQPPGTMKSLTVSVLMQAWEWGPAPDPLPGLRFLTTSYREDWARRDSRRCRDLIQHEWYRSLWPEIVLTRDGEVDFENTFLGNRKAVPFKSLTSGRGNRLVIDDPHSTEQAESEQDRQTTSRMFRESVPSRINDPEKDTIIVMMHRLHPEDVCGVIEELGLPYVKLILPMEFVRSLVVKTPFYEDPRKEDGELLCPNRLNRETVEMNKVELGEHAYATQYQQQARAREGSYFFNPENFLVKHTAESGAITHLPAQWPTLCQSVFAVMDTANKVGKNHDGTGITYYALTQFPEPNLRILDWDLIQIQANLLINFIPQVFDRLEELARETNAQMGAAGAWIEDAASGTVLLQQAQALSLNVHAIESKLTSLGKDARAVNVSGYIYKGQCKITKPAYEKTCIYHGKNKNHLWAQATGYRVGQGTTNDEDEMFDTLCYGVELGLGDNSMFT